MIGVMGVDHLTMLRRRRSKPFAPEPQAVNAGTTRRRELESPHADAEAVVDACAPARPPPCSHTATRALRLRVPAGMSIADPKAARHPPQPPRE
jgi:hypothetical protein